MENNYKKLLVYYSQKYKLSKDMHLRVFEPGDDANQFLFYFETMNVYPLFPALISLEVSDYTGSIVFNYNYVYKQTALLDTSYKVKINKKIKEYESIPSDEIENRQRNTMRKLFSYEIIDELTRTYNAEYVTVAWLKSYEILAYYKLIEKKGNTVNYFGICEQPGAFVFAINHYIKTKTERGFDFILESLVDPKNKKIFRPQRDLYNEHSEKYDYGYDKTGDVTNMANIKYYRDKYYDRHFDIISADCGLDCSDDFTLQEVNLLNVIFGQFILAISLADKGTNYFFKIFTIYENIMTDLIFLAKKYFKQVFICRTLTTKPDSGETYIICKKFLYEKSEMQNDIESLIKWFNKFFSNNKEVDVSNSRLLDPKSVPDAYYDEINYYNKILGLRRLVSIDMTIFRFKNNKYIMESKSIKKYVAELVEHYKNYFINIYGIRYLLSENHLVRAKIVSKWIDESKMTKKIVNSKSYTEYLIYRNLASYNQYNTFEVGKIRIHETKLDKNMNYDLILDLNIPHSAYYKELDKTADVIVYNINLSYIYMIHIYTLLNFLKNHSINLKKFSQILVTNISSRTRYKYFDLLEKMTNVNIDKKNIPTNDMSDIFNMLSKSNDDQIYYIRFRRSDIDKESIYSYFIKNDIIYKSNFILEVELYSQNDSIYLQKLIFNLKQFYKDVYIYYGENELSDYHIMIICLNSQLTKQIHNHDSSIHHFLSEIYSAYNMSSVLFNTACTLKSMTDNNFYLFNVVNMIQQKYVQYSKDIMIRHKIEYDKTYFE